MRSNLFNVLFFVSITLFCFGLYFHNIIEFQQDLGRHLLMGKITWQTHRVPLVNLFSYTNPNFHFVNSHWLSEVIFYLISLFNLKALLAFKVLIMSLSVLLVTYMSYRLSRSLLATILAFVVLSPVLLERTEIRPEMFSFLFIAVFLTAIYQDLVSGERSHVSSIMYKVLWGLPFLEILWVNLHIYFILGPVLVLLLLFSKIYSSFKETKNLKKTVIHNTSYIILLALTCAATLFNPNFISGALYPLHVFDNYGYTIVENQNIFFLEGLIFNPNIFYFKISAVIFLLSFVVTDWKKLSLPAGKAGPFSILLSTLIVLPIMNIRSFPLFFFLELPVLAANFAHPSRLAQSWSKSWSLQKIKVIGLICLIGLIFIRTVRLISNDYYLSTDSEKRFGNQVDEAGHGSIDFFFQNKLAKPVFNNFDIGGYLDYRFYPQQKVFVDNRPEAYPAKFLQNIYIPMEESRENFDNVDKIYNFKTIIFAHTDATPWGEAFLQQIISHPNWSLVYVDDYAAVFIKKGTFPQIPPLDLEKTNLSSKSYLANLAYGRLFSLWNRADLARQAFEKAYELNPDSAAVNQALGIVYSSNPQTSILADKYLKAYKEKSSGVWF